MSAIVPPDGARDGQLIDGGSLLVRLANFVKLPHTVFAMPFALVGVLIASARFPITPSMVGWTLLAFTAARFAAMGFNRIVDRDVDAANPRTAMREIPRGALSVGQAKAAVLAASMLFVYAAWKLNPLCLLLSPVALLWIFGYSYTKRFTRWSHLWLGVGLSIAPVGGYLAVAGTWSDPWWMLCTLALVVVTWSGGFDILYALQDAEFDRRQGLHSIPSAIGVPNAILLSRALHVTAVVCLALVVLGDPFSMADAPFAAEGQTGSASTRVNSVLWGGVALVAAMLVWEHRLVKADDLTRLDAAFFTMNGVISIGFLIVVAAARYLAQGVLA
ncbi:MAG TPA: UbiA-like polyprenyltransferase [Gemmatimonas sp.]|nr:UbiA-like polyprenyltransferase [Gemmatimonas sp.]